MKSASTQAKPKPWIKPKPKPKPNPINYLSWPRIGQMILTAAATIDSAIKVSTHSTGNLTMPRVEMTKVTE